MSWFDAAGFANLAKNALKEAQKTIDKALISENESIEDSQIENIDAPQSTSNTLWESFTSTLFEKNNRGLEKGASSESDASSVSPSSEIPVISQQPKSSVYNLPTSDSLNNLQLNFCEISSPDNRTTAENQIIRRDSKNGRDTDRLSTISVESDRNSSESIEIIGSNSTPTPESENDLPKLKSIESSVEILSSSSVEVLDSTDDIVRRNIGDETSSESVEIIPDISPDEDNEELSMDEGESISLSESTLTMLEFPVALKQPFRDRILPISSSLKSSLIEPVPYCDIPVKHDPEVDVIEPETNEGLDMERETAEQFHNKRRNSAQPETKRGDWNYGSVSSNTTFDGSSSCDEGTIIGSSPDETPKEGTSSVSSLKSMLSEAINDCSGDTYELHREDSPMDRVEHVKVGSSGHTSGDELETAASSDIEVISSPNGNGDGSTDSRQSPAKLIYKSSNGKMSVIAVADNLIPEISGKYVSFRMSGYNREPSETSSGCSDDSVEIDRLLKKISELSETLEARESKLIDLSMKNAELSESNSNMKSQLECQVNEEHSQRLAALEKKFQQVIREKDSYRKQLETLKQNSDFEEDKDQIIKELREEGEKLSKQQLSANVLIKKLRTSEKDHLKLISSLREQHDGILQELERTKKSLNAKETLEKSQTEMINQLTKANQKFDKQISSMQSQIDTLTSTLVALQKELQETDEALINTKIKLAESVKEANDEAVEKMKQELNAQERKQNELKHTINDMRQSIQKMEQHHSKQESMLRQENSQLLRNLEDFKRENENLKEEIVSVMQPITKQLQGEIDKYNNAVKSWDKKELVFNQSINELQDKLLDASNKENIYLKLYEEKSEEVGKLQKEKEELNIKFSELESKYKNCKLEIDNLQNKVNSLSEENFTASKKLQVREIAVQTEINNEQIDEYNFVETADPSYSSSPILSVRRMSLSESWPVFNDDEPGSSSSQMGGSIYDGYSKPIATATSLLENFQSQIKQREGEIEQLRWELKRREHERNMLTDEVSKLTIKVDELEPYINNFNVLQRQYNELLQMYGEKAEAFKELQLDMEDIKEIHKLQITQLLDKQ